MNEQYKINSDNKIILNEFKIFKNNTISNHNISNTKSSDSSNQCKLT